MAWYLIAHLLLVAQSQDALDAVEVGGGGFFEGMLPKRMTFHPLPLDEGTDFGAPRFGPDIHHI